MGDLNADRPTADRPTRTVLITGATGLVGRHAVNEFLSAGWRVVVAVRSASIAIHFPSSVIVKIVGTIGVHEDWSCVVEGVDVVVHCAAHAHVNNPRRRDLEQFERVNVNGTVRLARAARAAGVARLVFVSTVGVNGDHTDDGRPFRADDPARPATPYAWSKWQAEQRLTEALAGSSTEWVIVRPPLVFGPGARGNFTRLARLVERGIPLPVAGLRNKRSVISVWNLASFLRCAAEHPRSASRVWLVADPRDLSTPEIIRGMASALSRPARLWSLPAWAMKIFGWASGHGDDVAKLSASLCIDRQPVIDELGWIPPLSTEAGLARLSASSLGTSATG